MKDYTVSLLWPEWASEGVEFAVFHVEAEGVWEAVEVAQYKMIEDHEVLASWDPFQLDTVGVFEGHIQCLV